MSDQEDISDREDSTDQENSSDQGDNSSDEDYSTTSIGIQLYRLAMVVKVSEAKDTLKRMKIFLNFVKTTDGIFGFNLESNLWNFDEIVIDFKSFLENYGQSKQFYHNNTEENEGFACVCRLFATLMNTHMEMITVRDECEKIRQERMMHMMNV
jgi:hypothetical protein